MEEQGIVVAGLLAELHGVRSERPVETPAALGRQIVAEIFVEDDRLVDREIQPLDVGEFLLGDAGKLVAPLDDRHIAAERRLLGAKRGDDVGARLLGPVGARLDHSAGGQRADMDVGTKHQQLVVALRQGELDVGKLPRLHAGAQRGARRKSDRKRLPTCAYAPPQHGLAPSCPNRRAKKSPCF